MSDKAAPHVFTAIHAVLSELSVDGISKDRKNEQQKYKFRGIDDVLNALSGSLARNKLVILPVVKKREVSERESRGGGALFSVVVESDYVFTSAVDGSQTVATVIGEAMDSADKATNKAMSAAYKYMALQTFCIPTEGDNDADATTHDVRGRQQDERPPRQVERQESQAASDQPNPEQRGQSSNHPLMPQLEALLNKYGEKRKTFEDKVAEAFNVKTIFDIPGAVLPQALLMVQKHQKEAKEAKAKKAAAAKASNKKPDPEPLPDDQHDQQRDEASDDGIPV